MEDGMLFCSRCGAKVVAPPADCALQNQSLNQTVAQNQTNQPPIQKIRAGMLTPAVLCFLLALVYLLPFIEPLILPIVLFFDTLGIMFFILAKSPKNTPYILGKQWGMRKSWLVVACIIIPLTISNNLDNIISTSHTIQIAASVFLGIVTITGIILAIIISKVPKTNSKIITKQVDNKISSTNPQTSSNENNSSNTEMKPRENVIQTNYQNTVTQKIAQKNNSKISTQNNITNGRKTNTNAISFTNNMDGHEFEYFCADLLRKNGFSNVIVTPASNDYGVDITAIKDGKRYAIQCKRFPLLWAKKLYKKSLLGVDFIIVTLVLL